MTTFNNDTTIGRDENAWAADADATQDLGADSGTEDPEVEALIVDIATTRSEMSDTVDELGDRLAPSAVAERAGDAVREATVGKLEAKVNEMSQTAGDLVSNAGQTAQETGSGIVETIRRNPIPAVMAGVGIGWLWMNRSAGRTSGQWNSTQWRGGSNRPLRSGWEAGDDGWRRSESEGFSSGGSTSPSIGDRARDASAAVGETADNARRAAGDAVDNLGMTVSRATDQVGANASDVVSQAQQAIESNPLAFGAVAVAVGTAIGLALPATQTEKRMMGSTGGRIIDQVESAVSEPLDQLKQSQQTAQQQTAQQQSQSKSH
ncbi:MAG TPA: DUF3618 domain-containing protein [Candidatus Limnocylindrales bacterium]|nr:DUF3618 domain-containing protein [Candidatus Limnocylindrales bacterium]